MKISEHAEHTEKLYNLRAEDIHKWIDGFFDRQGFDEFLRIGKTPGYNPYDHRKFRHCREALPEVYKEFAHKYTKEQIRQVFECHIRDDYNDYIPSREDFSNGTFSEKYHYSEVEEEKILTPGELTRYFKGIRYGKDSQKKSYSLSFGLRIVLPAAISLILFITSIFMIILPLFHESLMEEKKEMIREISSVAASILDYYISLESDGTLSREEAQITAIDEIYKLRYGPAFDNYFWVTDMNPVMIMHPWRSDLNGKDLSNYTDSKNKSGKKLFVESVRLVKENGGGFLEYLWQLDEEVSRVVPKLSYVQGIPSWEWIIGTGIYIQDVEEEINRLTYNLVIILIVIASLLLLILVYVVFQSRIIERNRKYAETGLVEAKERYRALVEASNEGYILMLNHRNVFVNPTFQRMTGYDEKDLLSDSIWDIMFPPLGQNSNLKSHLENLKQDNSSSDEFEVQLRCRSGSLLDVIVRVSRIFLSEENGHIVSFRSISGSSLNVPLFMDQLGNADPVHLLDEIRSSESGPHIIRILNQLPLTVHNMIDQYAGVKEIRTLISEMFATALSRFIEISISEMGNPPADFAFLSLGSSGRGEMTLFSDQDNALVFDCNEKGEERGKKRLYFLKLADRVCSRLNQAGFPYCPGGIMAVNPAYCLSVEEWHSKYSNWINRSDNVSLLDFHVFFDLSCGWGNEDMVNELQSYIFQISKKRPEFLGQFARNCLHYKIPHGMLGIIKTEERDGLDVINLKECLIPLINFARLYSLKSEIPGASTLQRLKKLEEAGVLSKSSAKDLYKAFDTLWKLRFTNQIVSHGALRKVNDDLNLKSLSLEDRKKLQDAVTIIAGMQSRLSFDFFGMNLV